MQIVNIYNENDIINLNNNKTIILQPCTNLYMSFDNSILHNLTSQYFTKFYYPSNINFLTKNNKFIEQKYPIYDINNKFIKLNASMLINNNDDFNVKKFNLPCTIFDKLNFSVDIDFNSYFNLMFKTDYIWNKYHNIDNYKKKIIFTIIDFNDNLFQTCNNIDTYYYNNYKFDLHKDFTFFDI